MEKAERAKYGSVVAKIEALLSVAPMTRTEICDAENGDKDRISSIITRMRRSGRIHIFKYVRGPVLGERDYIRAVYKLGPGVDAKKPRPLTKKEVSRRNKRYDPRKRISTVFDLGLTRDQRLSKMRKRQSLEPGLQTLAM